MAIAITITPRLLSNMGTPARDLLLVLSAMVLGKRVARTSVPRTLLFGLRQNDCLPCNNTALQAFVWDERGGAGPRVMGVSPTVWH